MTWKKGQSGNPWGRASLIPKPYTAQNFSRSEFTYLMNKFLNLTLPEIQALVKAGTLKAKEVMIASLIIASISEKGDPMRIELILSRLIGKIPSKEEIDGMDLIEKMKALDDLPEEELIKRAESWIMNAKAKLHGSQVEPKPPGTERADSGTKAIDSG